MAVFCRGLDEQFIDALNREYEKSGWWRRLADDKDLFIGIRDNYLNVYFNGGSILALEYTQGVFCGKTHFKYLLDVAADDTDGDYVKFSDGKFEPVDIKDSYRDVLANIEGIKEATKRHQGDEKRGVHQIIIDNTNVVDVEIQLPDSNLRIDFAALQRCKDKMRIVFFEAKTYASSEIRATGRPQVLDQIKSYEEIIDRRRSEIEACYRQVLCDVQSINGWHSRRHKMFADATAGELYVDPKVRLVIFNFDAPQLRAANREPNGALHKLREALGRKLVLTKGDPKAFIKGIKSPE